MNVCICGWYYNKGFIDVMNRSLSLMHDIFIIGHRDGDAGNIQKVIIQNVGLEFGAYDFYLKNIWGGGDVIFIHDDTEFDFTAWNKINLLGLFFDQVFIHENGIAELANGFAHGRALFCSERFLTRLLKDDGFWYAKGQVVIENEISKEEKEHNRGIKSFLNYCMKIKAETGLAVAQVVNIPEIRTGWRGQFLNFKPDRGE
jgi:hypothetical protein